MSAQAAGRLLHVRCLARETQLAYIEQEERARRARERALDLTRRAWELIEQSLRAQRDRRLDDLYPAALDVFRPERRPVGPDASKAVGGRRASESL